MSRPAPAFQQTTLLTLSAHCKQAKSHIGKYGDFAHIARDVSYRASRADQISQELCSDASGLSPHADDPRRCTPLRARAYLRQSANLLLRAAVHVFWPPLDRGDPSGARCMPDGAASMALKRGPLNVVERDAIDALSGDFRASLRSFFPKRCRENAEVDDLV